LQLLDQALKPLPVLNCSAVRKPYSQTVCIAALYYAPESRVDLGSLECDLNPGMYRD